MLSVYISVFTIFIIYLLFESFLLQRRLRSIPIRILVNGTRGKSTIVLLIYQLLRKKGYQVFAKTTGDAPVIYNHDGSKTKLKRIGPARILENVRLLNKWSKKKPHAVVLECMALQPEMQHIMAKFIFKPTDTFITNIFPDHNEVMGRTLSENTRTIARCIHPLTTVFCLEETDALLASANIHISRKFICEKVESPIQLGNIPQQILDNSWSLIKKTAALRAIDSSDALNCFLEVWDSTNNKIKHRLSEKNVTFWDLYSVNDIPSAHQFISYLIERHSDGATIIFNLNCRDDRPLRTQNFVCLISEHYPNSELWLTGNGRRLAKRLCRRENISGQQVQVLSEKKIIENLHRGFSEFTMIFGIGNRRGTGIILETIGKISGKEIGD